MARMLPAPSCHEALSSLFAKMTIERISRARGLEVGWNQVCGHLTA